MALLEPNLVHLQQRVVSLDTKLTQLERLGRLIVACRQLDKRLHAATAQVAALRGPLPPPPQAEQPHGRGGREAYEAALEGASPTQAKLATELWELGFSRFRFVRVPPDYYERPLEWRREQLGAASVHHLCKALIMENTRAHASVQGCADRSNSKYYLVVVQYTTRLHTDKLRRAIQALNRGRVSAQYFNMRLAPGEVSDALSGYAHNAVTPIAIATRVPIVLSAAVAKLPPDELFFLGAGEVDLKVGVSAREFVAKYDPLVLDVTYDASCDDGADDGWQREE